MRRRSRRLRALAGLALMLAAGLLVPGAARSGAPAEARVLFVTHRASAEIYVMDADGRGETPITHRDPNGFGPAWSPDGSLIAFTGLSGDTSVQLWIMDANGDNSRPLGFKGSAEQALLAPDWSPTGRRLVVSYKEDVFVVSRDGTERRRLTRGRGEDWDPAWSPAGGWIAFTRNGFIHRIRTDGTDRELLARGSGADWSPSGRRIVFAVERPSGRRDIYTMKADGSDRRRLTTARADERTPSWSPGGGWIAFTRGRPGSVWVVRPNGSRAHRLLGNAGGPSWSPRGGSLAFSRSRSYLDVDGDEELAATIFTMRADGSAVTRLLTPEFDRSGEASPDGRRIVYASVRPFSQSGVYVVDADGANEVFLHSGWSPDWSPDGSRILLQDADGFYVVDSDGSSPSKLPDPGGLDFPAHPQWHPDGLHVSLVSGPFLCADVYVMDLDGTDLTRMTGPDCLPSVVDFDWHPSGTSLVFSGVASEDDCCQTHIYGAPVPDGVPTALTNDPFFSDDGPRVSPDGATVVFTRIGDFSEGWIWSMNLDGSAENRLTASRADYASAWLPAVSP